MIKQLVIPLAAVALFIVIVGMFVQKSGTLNVGGLEKTVAVGGNKISVELANTKELRVKGLSGKVLLGLDSGMLFIFDTQNVSPSFWMKDMMIPLDIIWINDGKVVKIEKNVQPPPPGTADNKLTVYSPGQLVNYVLEVNAGFADKNGVKTGDPVDLSGI